MKNEVIQLRDKMVYKPDGCSLKGHITITDQNKNVLVDKDNHIVLTGRQWLMERMFNMVYKDGTEYNTWLPGWFAVGSGGASQDSPLTPIWPADEDVDLYNPETLGGSGDQYSSDGIHKTVDSIEFVSNICTKLTMTLDYDDVDTAYINEAGLFVAPSTDSSNTDFRMFSHVTFPSFAKSQYQKLTIEWYVSF